MGVQSSKFKIHNEGCGAGESPTILMFLELSEKDKAFQQGGLENK